MLISQILKTGCARANETVWYDGAQFAKQDHWAIIQFMGERMLCVEICVSPRQWTWSDVWSDDAQSGQIHIIPASKNVAEVEEIVGADGYGCPYCVHNHVTTRISTPIDSMNAHMWLQATAYGPIIGAFVVLPGRGQCGFAMDCGVTTFNLW